MRVGKGTTCNACQLLPGISISAPGKVEHGLAIVVGDLDLHGSFRVDLDEDEWQRQRSGRGSLGRGHGRQRACRPVHVAYDQVAVRCMLLARLLSQENNPPV